jgi:hypothetical protein
METAPHIVPRQIGAHLNVEDATSDGVVALHARAPHLTVRCGADERAATQKGYMGEIVEGQSVLCYIKWLFLCKSPRNPANRAAAPSATLEEFCSSTSVLSGNDDVHDDAVQRPCLASARS